MTSNLLLKRFALSLLAGFMLMPLLSAFALDDQPLWQKPQPVIDQALQQALPKSQTPGTALTRAQFANLLAKSFLVINTKPYRNNYQDLTTTTPYVDSIQAAIDANFVEGYPDNKFRPYDKLSNLEMVAGIINASKEPLLNEKATELVLAADSKWRDDGKTLPEWSRQHVATAVKLGILPVNFEPSYLRKNATEQDALKLTQAMMALRKQRYAQAHTVITSPVD